MPNSDDRHHKPDHKPPGQQPPGGGNIGHVTSFDSGSYELRIAEAIIGGDVGGGGSAFTVGLKGGLFDFKIADDVKSSIGGGAGGGVGRVLRIAFGPYSIVGAVGIIG